MYQDFEKAYRELVKMEVPDLWGRIEAGLNEKSAPVTESIMIDESADCTEKASMNKSIKHAENAGMNGSIKRAENAGMNGSIKRAENAGMNGSIKRAKNAGMEENVKKKFRFVTFIKRYSALAAAVFCICLVIPAVTAVIQTKEGSSYSGSTDSMQSAAKAFDTATAPEANEPEYMSAETEESAQADISKKASTDEWTGNMADGFADVTEKGYDAGEDEKAALSEDGPLADFSDEMKREEALENPDLQKAEKQEATINNTLSGSAAASLTAGMVLENVTVKITETEDYFNEQELEETGTLYTAIVQEDASGTLAEGEEIVIFIPIYSSFAMSKDGTFTLRLAFCDKENYSFILYKG